MSLGAGVFKPPVAQLVLSSSIIDFFPVTAHILSVNKYAGAAIGSATVAFPAHYAKDASPDMGKEGKIKIDGQIVFRGVVGDAVFNVVDNTDMIEVLLYDDKHLMQSKIVGQIGVGTTGTPIGTDGFIDVGFEIIFNKDGKPNKSPLGRDFNTGSTAVLWTLKDIMLFVFENYVPTSAVTIASGKLGTNYSGRKPSHLNLTGKTALQAVDQVATMAGESWGLIAGSTSSTFTFVKPGVGSVKKGKFFKPNAGAGASDVDKFHGSGLNVSKSIMNARDVYQAVSSLKVKESVYSKANTLLTGAAITDKKFTYRFTTDVSKYATNNLGANLSAGSKPKPWQPSLLTRMNADGTAY